MASLKTDPNYRCIFRESYQSTLNRREGLTYRKYQQHTRHPRGTDEHVCTKRSVSLPVIQVALHSVAVSISR